MLLCVHEVLRRPRDLSVRSRSFRYWRNYLIHGSSNPKQNNIIQEFILPNFSTNRHGHIRLPGDELLATDQVLHMENERFTIPELLFRPDDIGLFSFYAFRSKLTFSVQVYSNQE